jgi:hypothetical protein
MDIGSILVILAILIIIVAYIARPLVENRGFAITDADRRYSTLLAQRDQVLTILQELDMDHSMGKVPQEDYQAQRTILVARGASVLKEMDHLRGPGKATLLTNGSKDVATSQLEAQIEEAVSQIRTEQSGLDANYCSSCGNALEGGDLFCVHCGTPIKVGEK